MNLIIILFVTAIIGLFAGVFKAEKYTQYISLLGLIVAFAFSFQPDFALSAKFSRMFLYDQNVKIFSQIAIIITFLIFLLGGYAFKLHEKHKAELYSLFLFSLCGAILLFGYQNLVVLFLGIEILSIPLYILAGSNKHDLRSGEASMKYFLMGAFATGFLLFGIALIYGVTGTFDVHSIRTFSFLKADTFPTIYMAGIVLMLIGLLFKVSIFPFHFWSPDVYEGSPSIVTSFMASVVKISGFAALFKLLTFSFFGQLDHWQNVIYYLAIITLIVANVLGTIQTNAKRMLAYSSVSHAGYLLLIFFNYDKTSASTLSFYLLAYSVATVGVFASLIYVERIFKGLSDNVTFNGLAKKQPLLAFTAAVSMLSMAGIPLTAGFMGKLTLFKQAMVTQPNLIIVAIIGSAISIAYYLRLIIHMYFKPINEELKNAEKAPVIYNVVGVIVLLIIFILGVYPQPLFDYFSSFSDGLKQIL